MVADRHLRFGGIFMNGMLDWEAWLSQNTMHKLFAARPFGIRGRIFSLFFFFALSMNAWADQPSQTNKKGISVMGVHLIVRNPEEDQKLWAEILGATVGRTGSLEFVEIPGLRVVLEKGQPTGGSDGSTVNHIGLWIQSHDEARAKIEAAHLEIVADNYNAAKCAEGPGTQACQMMAVFPDGVKVEFTEDKKLVTKAAGHHIHMFVTDPQGMQEWYAKNFGGSPYLRRGAIVAVKFDSGELDFNKAAETQQPTKGRAVDHIALKVKGLEALCKSLKNRGLRFDTECHTIPGTRFKSALITDPAGTRVELIEGAGGR